jgi:hypothetical protein
MAWPAYHACRTKKGSEEKALLKKDARFQTEYLRRLIDELSSIPSTFRLPQEAQIFSEA